MSTESIQPGDFEGAKATSGAEQPSQVLAESPFDPDAFVFSKEAFDKVDGDDFALAQLVLDVIETKDIEKKLDENLIETYRGKISGYSPHELRTALRDLAMHWGVLQAEEAYAIAHKASLDFAPR